MNGNPNGAMRIKPSRKEARVKLSEQIEKGEHLSQLDIQTPTELKAVWNKYRIWHDYVKDLLKTLFTTDTMYQEFVEFAHPRLISSTFEQERKLLRSWFAMDLNKLTSIDNRLVDLFEEDSVTSSTSLTKNAKVPSNNKAVFVVHGRSEKLKESMFDFLKAIGLEPLEWPRLKAAAMAKTKQASPYVGEIIKEAFEQAPQGIIVLLSGDDEARLRKDLHKPDEPDYETELMPQARPNVLFEGGMAMGILPEKTILVQVGEIRPFSDIVGRYVIHLDNSHEKKQQLIVALKNIQCKVDDSSPSWMNKGDFDCN